MDVLSFFRDGRAEATGAFSEGSLVEQAAQGFANFCDTAVRGQSQARPALDDTYGILVLIPSMWNDQQRAVMTQRPHHRAVPTMRDHNARLLHHRIMRGAGNHHCIGRRADGLGLDPPEGDENTRCQVRCGVDHFLQHPFVRLVGGAESYRDEWTRIVLIEHPLLEQTLKAESYRDEWTRIVLRPGE